MKCPYCGELESKVIDSRPTEDGEKIRRRRECLRCGKRFTTYEIVETVPLMVIKKDRSRQVFDRQKLLVVCCAPAKSARSAMKCWNARWITSSSPF